MTHRLFTSESVTEGHPDKIADQISDSILDALLKEDPRSRVAVETLITTGQVHVAGEVTTKGYADIPTFALAKEREEIFAPGRAEPIVQERNSPGMFLVQRIRDEAHRFAITHHRKVRSRKALTSPLDSVEGIGPARKRALLRHFGSVQAIREAPVDEIVKLGIPERLAARLKETL